MRDQTSNKFKKGMKKQRTGDNKKQSKKKSTQQELDW